MHLKKIEIQGFKSFADKIEIKFKDGITAIVGPNGSGKSNVSDAIKWVLGEQSVKALRGSKMEDIIFSGTDKRKPLGYAEATITFDNITGIIPVDYQEVAITRRMFRSGESEYYLNKNACRLRDIKELFMDTGVGTDGYSIIGQGRVDEILSSRPEDRRRIFEEAAGIVKYKSKKISAERKLEKTDDNLERIKDILRELEKQFESLKRQSRKASSFKKISNELKELEINIYIREIDKIQIDMKESKNQKMKLQSNINGITKEKDKIEKDFQKMNIEIEEMDEKINTVQNEKIQVLNKLNKSKNQCKVLNEQKKYNIKDTERLKEEIGVFKIEIQESKATKLSLIQKKDIDLKEFNRVKKEFDIRKLALDKLNKELQVKKNEIEKYKSQNINLYNEIVDKKSQTNGNISFEENITKRILQIEKNIENLLEQNKKDRISLEKIQNKKEEKNQKVISHKKLIDKMNINVKEDEERLSNILSETNEIKLDLQDKKSNFKLLKNMEEDYEGYYRSVKNLIIASKKEKNLENKVVGIVADLIKVEEKYEKAIDIGLGGRLQNVVTMNEYDTKFIIDYLRKNNLGRVTFLPMSTIKGKPVYISPKDRKDFEILGLGSEIISYDEEYKAIIEYMLGRTIIVENLDIGNKVAKKFNYSFRIVTLEGDIINPGGSMTGGSLPKISGNLLNRKYRIENLQEKIQKTSKIKENLEKEQIIYKSALKKDLSALKKQEKKLNEISIQIIQTENEENKYKDKLKRSNDSINNFKAELKSLSLESNEIDKNKIRLNKEIFELKEKNKTLKENIKEIELEFEKKKDEKKSLEKEVTETQIAISLLENKTINKVEQIDSIGEDLKKKKQLKEQKSKEFIESKCEIDNILDEINLLEKSISNFSKLEKEKENNSELLKSQKHNFMKGYYKKQEKLKKTNEDLGNMEKEKNYWEVKEAKESVKLENLNIKLLEDYELIYYEAKEMLVEIENLNHTKAKVKELKNQVKNLGTVNLDSIEEFEVVSERLMFIKDQYKDLIDAKNDLQKVIKDMEIKMKKQFIYSFNQINENFNEIFLVLFDGGRAELLLEDEENILTCGIEIQAQPPGKRLQNLSLLSGGEKSLAAVALLFSILKMRPTPFCVLDEIDASLDEANISRYTKYLESFSDDTQFIMITHRKNTMEVADVLYGITMEEKGISKMVSVKLTDALETIAS